jgi:hypothetical protein
LAARCCLPHPAYEPASDEIPVKVKIIDAGRKP